MASSSMSFGREFWRVHPRFCALGALAVLGLVFWLGGLAVGITKASARSATNTLSSPAVDTGSTAPRSFNQAPEVTSGPVTNPATAVNWLLSKASTRAAVTGGVDPHGDSLLSIRNSMEQFAHPEFILRLFLNLSLAGVCAWVLGWHPRRWRQAAAPSDAEERKTLIILGVVGAIVAELSSTSPTLAFVIFGIGALLRFRTVLDNPKATGKAILAVVTGLACGLGSWTMAVFVTVFSWLLLLWLESHIVCTMTIRLSGTCDAKLEQAVQSVLAARHCRLHRCKLSKGNKRVEFLFDTPAGLDRSELEAEVKARLPKNGERSISIEAA